MTTMTVEVYGVCLLPADPHACPPPPPPGPGQATKAGHATSVVFSASDIWQLILPTLPHQEEEEGRSEDRAAVWDACSWRAAVHRLLRGSCPTGNKAKNRSHACTASTRCVNAFTCRPSRPELIELAALHPSLCYPELISIRLSRHLLENNLPQGRASYWKREAADRQKKFTDLDSLHKQLRVRHFGAWLPGFQFSCLGYFLSRLLLRRNCSLAS